MFRERERERENSRGISGNLEEGGLGRLRRLAREHVLRDRERVRPIEGFGLTSACSTWRWRLLFSTWSWSTTPIRPTPAAARYRQTGDPRPPAPTTRTEDSLSFRWLATPKDGRTSCLAYRSISSLSSPPPLHSPSIAAQARLASSSSENSTEESGPRLLCQLGSDNFTSRNSPDPERGVWIAWISVAATKTHTAALGRRRLKKVST